MNETIWTPQFTTAIWGFSGVVIGSLISWAVQSFLLGRRIVADERLAERKFKFDMELAERKFQYDRDLHDHKRRVEMAEAILADFLQMKEIISQIRYAASFENESKDRLRNKFETEAQTNQKNSYYIPLARTSKNSEFISNFMSKKYRSNAILGDNTEIAFNIFNEVLGHIQIAATALLQMTDRQTIRDDTNRAQWEKWEQYIWQDFSDPDVLNLKIQSAISIVEPICRSRLERT